MTKDYTDNQGNKYRKTSGGWEILRPGIGWQAFESTAYMTVISEDGAILTIEPTPQPEAAEAAEEKQVRKVREDELFVHFVDAWQSEQLKNFYANGEAIAAINKNADDVFKAVAITSCDYAQAMIDELKERGRI